ncbi:hypothetical protein [Microbacterium sp. KUDC0406]|uniref:hypothetical protein n=1 Tax=Microbacterium sp. KUDC0406 TaxID=2909588 RepID=UPI002E3811BF|nr:hypothetical protein [Microbacterium sp. KUDC0406]
MTTARIDADRETLVIGGSGPRPSAGTLSGARAGVTATITGGGKTWKATFPLRTSRWGAAELPLPAGSTASRSRVPI